VMPETSRPGRVDAVPVAVEVGIKAYRVENQRLLVSKSKATNDLRQAVAKTASTWYDEAYVSMELR